MIINSYRFAAADELYAAEFTAANSEYLSSTDAAFDFTSSFTVCAWVYINGAGLIIYPATKYGAFNDRSYTSTIAEGGVARFYIYNAAAVNHYATSTITPSNQTWHFFVGIFNASTNKVGCSLDGENLVEVSFSGTRKISTAPLYLGRQSTIYSNGRQDSTSFYTKPLTQAQISTLYNSGDGIKFAAQDKVGLLAHYKLNEESGTRYDAHASYDLTDNNTVTRAVGKILD